MSDASLSSPSTDIDGWDEFVRRFRPRVNHLNPNASVDFGYGGCLFETFGAEFEFARAQDPACIWTMIDEDGHWYALSGLHLVNRLGYFIAAFPRQDAEVECLGLDFYMLDEEEPL